VNKTERVNFEKKGAPEAFRCFSITDSDAEYGYVYYKNESESATIFDTCVFS
jgi:hypothetical protein